MKKISIIIPLYNKELSISKTIDTVLNQTYTDFELIIVNDGSTDKSFDIVKKISDSRIRIIDKENGGVSSARNVGIKESKGDIIALLDADDRWDKDYLETLANMIIEYPNAVMYAQACDKVYKEGHKIINNPFLKNKEISIISDYNIYIHKIPFVNSTNVALNKKYIETAGLFDETLTHGEDTDMWFRLAMCGSLAYSPFIKAHYMMETECRANLKKESFKKHISYKMINVYKDKFKDVPKMQNGINSFILNGFILFLRNNYKEQANYFENNMSFFNLSARDMVKYLFYKLKFILK